MYEHQRPDDIYAGALNRFGRRADWLGRSEGGGIGHVEEFRGKARILFHEFDDVVEIAEVRRKNFRKSEVIFWNRGECFCAADDFAKTIVSDEIAIVANATEEAGEVFEIDRFVEEAVSDGETFGDFEAVGVTRDNDASGLRKILNNFIEKLHSIHSGHGEVRDDDVERLVVQKVKGFPAVGGCVNFMSLA